ncbi:ubiquitin-like small modifier protein 1 [Methanonatronarchaeum sp. AMET6-2]|uniref:ubiquitin-like small modifier protein 1 n=1 Tax=Methanonatronarchaeum sp. AMET6-2 TaxID=2933293 RepID=UPI0012288426|nr:ubiquitin-like small modifier protein 1 [Methanonatronarchaeum sp. AMET6-2]RZN61831.1 MAG: MoaD/ThiS family protein [Methanonatronarchaeia archaeon]UOY09703.1 MoaD/ThiS family protein [Methanonatronarchaeum sp. AMET6-2]
MVQIKLFANFREATGKDQIKINTDKPITLKQLINQLEEKHPELKKELYNDSDNDSEIRSGVNILINQENIDSKTLDINVQEKDTVALLPPVSGG